MCLYELKSQVLWYSLIQFHPGNFGVLYGVVKDETGMEIWNQFFFALSFHITVSYF